MKELFTKQFYVYWFHKIKREKPWEYLFFDWLTFIFFIIVFLVGLLTFFPGKIQIYIPTINNQVYILESLLRNISLFIGISFSFILLSFNIFYRYFGRYAFIDFFKNKSARVCITLLTCTIGLLIYSTSYIREITEIDRFDKFLFLFSLTISVVSFFSVFPCLLILLRNSQNRDNIKRLFQRLNEEWLIEKFLARAIDKSLHKFYHKDPISILNEIGLSAIKEFDNKTISVISTTCIDFFIENSKKVEEDKSKIEYVTLFEEFSILLSNLFQVSVKERNESSSIMILNARFDLEECILTNLSNKGFENFNNDSGKYRHWNLSFNISDYFKRAIQFNEDEICKRIIDNYRDFSVQAVPILFPKNFIYSQANHFTCAQEVDVIFEPLRTLNDLASIIILNKKSQLFQAIFTLYYCIEQAVIKLDITDESKCFILNIIFNYKYDIFNQYTDLQEIQHISYLNYPFQYNSNTFNNINCSTPHLGSLQIMSLLFSKNKLNSVVINQQKAEVLQLIEIFTKGNQNAKKLIQNSINKFKEIASKIDTTANDYRKATYLKLEDYLRITYNVAMEKGVTDEEILNNYREALSLFTFKEQFKTELNNKGYISDDRIT